MTRPRHAVRLVTFAQPFRLTRGSAALWRMALARAFSYIVDMTSLNDHVGTMAFDRSYRGSSDWMGTRSARHVTRCAATAGVCHRAGGGISRVARPVLVPVSSVYFVIST